MINFKKTQLLSLLLLIIPMIIANLPVKYNWHIYSNNIIIYLIITLLIFNSKHLLTIIKSAINNPITKYINNYIISLISFMIFYSLKFKSVSGDIDLRLAEMTNACLTDEVWRQIIPNCIMMSSQLSGYWHRFLFNLLGKLPFSAAQIFTFLSCFYGALFILISLKYLDYLKIHGYRKLLLFLLIFTNGSIGVFFGWIENFSLFFLIISIYFYYSLKIINDNTNISYLLILTSILSLIHGLGIIFLIPTIYIIIIKYKEKKVTLKKLLIKFSVLVILPILIISMITFMTQYGLNMESLKSPVYDKYGLIGWSGLGTYSAIFTIGFVPFYKEIYFKYTFFSFHHIIDIIQIIVLTSLVFIPILIVQLKNLSFKNVNHKQILTMFFLTILPLLIFACTWRINVNQADWDLIGIFSIPLNFLILYLFSKNTLKINIPKLFPLIILGILTNTMWIISNL